MRFRTELPANSIVVRYDTRVDTDPDDALRDRVACRIALIAEELNEAR